MKGKATVKRKTKETDISVTIDFTSPRSIITDTEIPFFNHMLHAMAFHGAFGMDVYARGDIDVDPHHVVEDVGLVTGDVLSDILVEYRAVSRYGYSVIPMDDALSEIVIDVCDRPYFRYVADFPQDKAGNFDVALIREYLYALTVRAKINLHAEIRYGLNSHHMVESLFKALGKALHAAYIPLDRGRESMSTKGTL